MADGAKDSLLTVTVVMCFLFGVFYMTALAEEGEIQEPVFYERFATSTMDNSQIEQVLYLENRLDRIEKRLNDISENLGVIYEKI